MTTFLLDLWHDLREKRLWPVAAALLAATAAVPLLLFKPATHPSAAGSSAPSARTESLPVVTIADSSGNVSKLDAFAKHNPFQPLGDAAANPATPPSTGNTTGPGSKGSSSSTGSGGSGSPGSSGSGTPGASGSPGSSPGIKYFTFHVGVRFGKSGHEKSYKDVKQLQMLPDSKNPLVVFMGMTADYKSAVFMIDASKFSADGEGSCKPNANQCSFVELKVDDAHNEETLAGSDGTTYTLKLTGIKRVWLTADQAKGDSKDVNSPTSPTKGSPKAKAAGKDLPASSGGNADVSGSKQDSAPLFELPSFASVG
jgi:hypothetical protein